MDEPQLDVILFDADLAYPCADNAATSRMEVTQPAPADNFHRIGCNGSDDVSQLQNDILKGNRSVLKKRFDLMKWEHGSPRGNYTTALVPPFPTSGRFPPRFAYGIQTRLISMRL